jgi:hypothetical protein
MDKLRFLRHFPDVSNVFSCRVQREGGTGDFSGWKRLELAFSGFEVPFLVPGAGQVRHIFVSSLRVLREAE